MVPLKTIPSSRPKWAKCIPAFGPKRPKNHTLWVSTYLYGLYKGVRPPPRDSTKLESWAVHTFLKNLTKYYMLSNSLHKTCCTFPLPNFSTASHQAEAAPGTVTVCAELYGRWTSPSFTMPVVFNRSSDSLDAALPLNQKTTNMIKILILVIPLIKLQIAAYKKIHKGLNYTSE